MIHLWCAFYSMCLSLVSNANTHSKLDIRTREENFSGSDVKQNIKWLFNVILDECQENFASLFDLPKNNWFMNHLDSVAMNRSQNKSSMNFL